MECTAGPTVRNTMEDSDSINLMDLQNLPIPLEPEETVNGKMAKEWAGSGRNKIKDSIKSIPNLEMKNKVTK